ncbi:MAG: 2-C-methyl-D-erythritol 4-phosphate cytidylyltransferase [Steroidobacteraceae bacterium]
MRYWLVMPAAGAGTRFGAALPKQYAPLEGRTVIEWALAPFLDDPRCAHAVVALAPADRHWDAVARRLAATAGGGLSRVRSVTGGETRSRSVRFGLAALEARAAPDDWVLVHDAARPCLARADLDRLIEALESMALGGLLASPVRDTLKRMCEPATQVQDAAPAAPEVSATVERSGLWRALTPQMFRFRPLCTALDAARAAAREPGDEAEALEWRGERPLLIEGAAGNLKITGAEDLTLAAAILRARHRE